MKGGIIWTSCVLSLTMTLGCGGDRRSGAVTTADSGQTSAADRAAAGTKDSTPAVPAADTGRAAAGPDSASARQDTASTATQPKPPKKLASKPRAAKPAAPAAGPTKPTDSTTSDAGAPLRDEYHRAPLDTVSQEVYQGWKQFNLNCARCHGEDVQGTTIAPHLIVSLRPSGPINTKEIFVQTVCAGRPAKGMPAWCALGLDMEKINQIYSYVKGRSDSKIHPGRPAVKSGG